jgi:hypothetical protein
VELTSAMLHCDCSTKLGKTFRPEAFTVGGTRLAVDHDSWVKHNDDRQLGGWAGDGTHFENSRYEGGTKPEQRRPLPNWTKAPRSMSVLRAADNDGPTGFPRQ